MNPNDKAMLEKVKPGWWVYTQGICIMENKWLLVAESLEQYPSLVSVADGRDIVSRCRSDIRALHAPTDNPRMETAYLLVEPEEVTREEAEKMVKPNWFWLLPDGQAIRHAVDVLSAEAIKDMVVEAEGIESPGGNVYRIKEG